MHSQGTASALLRVNSVIDTYVHVYRTCRPQLNAFRAVLTCASLAKVLLRYSGGRSLSISLGPELFASPPPLAPSLEGEGEEERGNRKEKEGERGEGGERGKEEDEEEGEEGEEERESRKERGEGRGDREGGRGGRGDFLGNCVVYVRLVWSHSDLNQAYHPCHAHYFFKRV